MIQEERDCYFLRYFVYRSLAQRVFTSALEREVAIQVNLVLNERTQVEIIRTSNVFAWVKSVGIVLKSNEPPHGFHLSSMLTGRLVFLHAGNANLQNLVLLCGFFTFSVAVL